MALKELRTQKHWSQEDLAELSGLSVRTIQRIEQDHKAGLESLKSLAAAFNMDVAELRDALESPESNDAGDAGPAQNVMAFYAMSAFLALLLIGFFLPHALQDSSNWGAFAAAGVCYVILIGSFAAVTFGDRWKERIISSQKESR